LQTIWLTDRLAQDAGAAEGVPEREFRQNVDHGLQMRAAGRRLRFPRKTDR
jgi:hypothetical protein